MTKDRQVLLSMLNTELEFLAKGGYQHPARATWRPQFFFQDSPTCLNFDPNQRPKPCSDCALTYFASVDSQQKKYPCRYIVLNERGDTLDSLYRCGTQEEIASAVTEWLSVQIARLERANVESAADSEQPELPVNATSMFSFCANPDCLAPFDYRQGRLFRFHKVHPACERPLNSHSVQHFWLCGTCSGTHTLEYRDECGVLIRDLPESSDNLDTRRFVAMA
jgi:hypothetical protein